MPYENRHSVSYERTETNKSPDGEHSPRTIANMTGRERGAFSVAMSIESRRIETLFIAKEYTNRILHGMQEYYAQDDVDWNTGVGHAKTQMDKNELKSHEQVGEYIEAVSKQLEALSNNHEDTNYDRQVIQKFTDQWSSIWSDTTKGKAYLKKELSENSPDFFNSYTGKNWLFSEPGYEWAEENSDWINSPEGMRYMHAAMKKDPQELFDSPFSYACLVFHSEELLGSKEGKDWLFNKNGANWLAKSNWMEFNSDSVKEWLQTPIGKEWKERQNRIGDSTAQSH